MLTACDAIARHTDRPILLMNFRSSDADASFSNIRLIDTDDNEIRLNIDESITLQADEPDEDTGYSASVTYLLDDGRSYKDIIVSVYGADHHEPITIESAESNMVYYVQIYKSNQDR